MRYIVRDESGHGGLHGTMVDRWARKQGLNASSLCAAVVEMAVGLYDADLGDGLLKKRIARLAGEFLEVDCDAQDWIGAS